jgi:hypothetical protein
VSETLGSLIDKLSIVNLKIVHTNQSERVESLMEHQGNLIEEINELIELFYQNKLSISRLNAKANKVYDENKFKIRRENQSIGEHIDALIGCNFYIWKLQEKMYKFEELPANEKDEVVRSIAELNLKRNNYIDMINELLIKNYA